MKKPVIVSGIQPTGNLHLGNYLGAVKNWVDLQNSGKYDCYFFIADYHSLTGSLTAAERHERTLTIASELLAAGIDPKKSTLFVQSQVPGHTELAWIFNTVTQFGELKRMTQFKDKAGVSELEKTFEGIYRNEFGPLSYVAKLQSCLEKVLPPEDNAMNPQMVKNHLMKSNPEFIEHYNKINEEGEKIQKLENQTNVGLLTYPVLQAADILLYAASFVPVGQDQIQHVELTRDIARWFNKRYGVYFPEVKHLLTETPKVMSLLEPTKKMSKSHGVASVLELADAPEVLLTKLKKAVTATEGGDAPGVQNLLLLLQKFGSAEVHAQFVRAAKDGSIRFGDLKTAVGEAIGAHFAAFRKRREEYVTHPAKVQKILAAGAKKATKVASKTTKEVRKLVGLL